RGGGLASLPTPRSAIQSCFLNVLSLPKAGSASLTCPRSVGATLSLGGVGLLGVGVAVELLSDGVFPSTDSTPCSSRPGPACCCSRRSFSPGEEVSSWYFAWPTYFVRSSRTATWKTVFGRLLWRKVRSEPICGGDRIGHL